MPLYIPASNRHIDQVYIRQWSTPTKGGHKYYARTTGLRAEIVYGGDIQSIHTDH